MRISFDEVRRNKIKSNFLIFFFIILIGAIGAAIGAVYADFITGVIMAVFFAIIYSLIVYNSGSNMILGMSGARPVTKEEYPYLYHTIEGLAIPAQIPVPKAYVIKDSALNAFATGKDPKHASITVTTGLLEKMNRQELEGVIAHEMSHIKNLDIRMMMLAAVLVGVVVLLSDFMLRSFIWGGRGRRDRESGQGAVIIMLLALLLAILAPLFAQMIKLAVSRRREFLADANAVALTRYPPGLASALEKIRDDPDPLVDKANRATAHLFISTPFRKSKGGLMMARLFATHPPIEERIAKLIGNLQTNEDAVVVGYRDL